MNLSDINPHIRYASTHYYHISKPFDSICYDCRLFFIKEGRGRITANGLEYHFSNNTVIFFPPGTRYHFYPDKRSSSFISIVINFDLINDFNHLSKSLGTAGEHNFHPEQVITYPMPAEFSDVFLRTLHAGPELLDKCCEEFLIQNPLYRETASALLKLYLLDIVRNSGANSESAKFLPILDYIHTNYADTSLTNESIAERFNYHPYYLSQMIRQQTGQPLHRYLISYRIKMAKKYLITTDDAIGTIAWKSGFQSPAYFIKMFKEQVGMTPGAYRKEREQSLF